MLLPLTRLKQRKLLGPKVWTRQIAFMVPLLSIPGPRWVAVVAPPSTPLVGQPAQNDPFDRFRQ